MKKFGGFFDYDSKISRIAELDNALGIVYDAPTQEIISLMKERSQLKEKVVYFKKLSLDLEAVTDLLQSNDDGQHDQIIESEMAVLSSSIKTFYQEIIFGNELDSANCFVELLAGAGGTESGDWTRMLMRMYLRWAELHKIKVECIDILEADMGGIRSAMYKFSGKNCFGWLQNETGVHRLVRISPFDSNARRHTSFASVSVLPVPTTDSAVTIRTQDLKIDTYRASGAGGQHVNKTDSAVRITHLPSGIVVQSQDDRSQHRNKDSAMKILQAKLLQLEAKKQKEKEKSLLGDKVKDVAWGMQIRSYVLHPYQLIKDERSKYQTSNSEAILNGRIDDMLLSSLMHARGL